MFAMFTRGQVVQVLGEPMTLPNAPDTRTWPCPVCAVGADSFLVTDEGELTCTEEQHTREEIEQGIARLLALAHLDPETTGGDA